MADALIVETAIGCLEREFPPGLTSLVALDDRVNAELRARDTSVAPERLVELLAADPRVLVEYRDGDATPWVRLRSAVTDDDARARLVEILLEARTFDEIWGRITAESAAESHPLFRDALRLLAEGKPNSLDDPLKESFAQALTRFPDNPRAVELAGILHAHAEDLRR
ncbi:MAG TPA: hypothetical protein VLJ38_09180 [Polyangiaceae bacterium]|nr:hypothetical protein [Polyangiaceae bacterium]